jgi:signal transduction histidine kinase
MRPPPDRRIDITGASGDLPLTGRPRYGVGWPLVFAVASLLGIMSSMLAWQFTLSMGRPATYWRTLVVLNTTYWYVWAAFAPAIVWLSQHFRLERPGLARALAVHLPSVAIFSFAHIAMLCVLKWWIATAEGRAFALVEEIQRSTLQNFDWEMMTYWAIAGLSHAVLYYREARDRAVRAAQLETRLVEAQLQALQQQLQPHFLFNTLHAISALMHRDVEAADRTLMRLSDLLRMTLESLGRQENTVKAELEFLSKYLEIERTRFADRLTVGFDVHAETLDAQVPTLLLQPLVENAIKHGISKKGGTGHIHVTVRRDHDKLWIEVRDNGAGLSETALTALQKGLGVSTTRVRLQHLFGADYRFEFHRLAEGLAVVVAVPWRVADEAAPAADDRAAPTTTNDCAINAANRIASMGATGARA